MCRQRLPNNTAIESRPSGMLDRDQRTALTITLIRGDESITRSHFATIGSHSLCGCVGGRWLLSEHRACWRTTRRKTDLTSSSANDWIARRNIGDIIRQEKSRNFHYRPRRKFLQKFLLFTCFWLSIIHRTCAYPLPEAAMSDVQSCNAIKKAINETIKYTNMEYLNELLKKYTVAQFKKEPIELHDEWKTHSAHFKYESEYAKQTSLPENFEGELPKKHFAHLPRNRAPTKNELSSEFQKMYVYLHVVDEVFKSILRDRTKHADQIAHQMRQQSDSNDQNSSQDINQMFSEQNYHCQWNINKVESAMQALHIPTPKLPKIKIEPRERSLGEWLTIREHLKVLRYMQEVFNIWLDGCSHFTED